MNIKGLLFLFLSVIVLTVTINTVRNNNHFFIRYRSNISFEQGLEMKETFYVMKDTDIYIESFKDSDEMAIKVEISNTDENFYLNTTGRQSEPYRLHLKKGLYQLSVNGENGLGNWFDLQICYFTDEMKFLNEES
jgi:hypothetical protein